MRVGFCRKSDGLSREDNLKLLFGESSLEICRIADAGFTLVMEILGLICTGTGMIGDRHQLLRIGTVGGFYEAIPSTARSLEDVYGYLL